MGTVFVAEQHAPRRTVALKVLTRAPDPDTLAQFRREAAVIAELEHPWIVPLYSYGEHAGQPYLVMRYLKGGSLAGRLREGPAELTRGSRWVDAIAEALDFAHGRGLVHRDVKPSNILLDELGNAYLSDFGIAGALADARAGLPTGSAAYMSPEQGRGEVVDRRADIYALAVALFESLTGQPPYSAETALGVIVRHIHDPIPSAGSLNPSVPRSVDEVIQLAMAKDPAQRPQTAGEFAELVRQASQHPEASHSLAIKYRRPEPRPADQQDAATAIAPPGAAKPLPGQPAAGTVAVRQPRPRKRWMWALAAFVLVGLALVGGVGLATALLPSATEIRPTATSPAIRASGPTFPSGPILLLADDFSDPTSGFAVLSDVDGGVEYADGSLRFAVLTEGARWYSYSRRLEAQDVEIEVTAQLVSGPPLSELAILCRWQGLEDFTALAVRGDGAVGVWQVRGGVTSWLLDWAEAPGLDLSPGEPFRMSASCRGPDLGLAVNGIPLAQVTDPQPSPGDVALMAGLGESGELVVLFDDLEVFP
jgi:serine/threonine-protein kinase